MGLDTIIAATRNHIPKNIRYLYRGASRVISFIPRQAIGTITCVDTNERVVALTFDDGPHPESTPRLLDILDSRARATFFLVGKRVETYPDLVARIREGGHAIANHSWSHRSFPALTSAERRQETLACQSALGPTAPKLFRPPYGNFDLPSSMDAVRMGYDVVTWSISGSDWHGFSSQEIANRILTRVRPGSIVLLHELLYSYEDLRYVTRDATFEAVRILLEKIGDRYSFVTVPELLAIGRPHRELWIQKGDPAYLAQLKTAEEFAEQPPVSTV